MKGDDMTSRVFGSFLPITKKALALYLITSVATIVVKLIFIKAEWSYFQAAASGLIAISVAIVVAAAVVWFVCLREVQQRLPDTKMKGKANGALEAFESDFLGELSRRTLLLTKKALVAVSVVFAVGLAAIRFTSDWDLAAAIAVPAGRLVSVCAAAIPAICVAHILFYWQLRDAESHGYEETQR